MLIIDAGIRFLLTNNHPYLEEGRVLCREELDDSKISFAWEKARKLTARIYKVTSEGSFARDFDLKDQIRRASVSVMSNIAEGFERNSPAEFHRFLVIAKGSCAELRNQLYVALDVAHIPQQEFEPLMSDAVELSRIIGGLRAAVHRRRVAAKHVL